MDFPRRKPARLSHFDYSAPGAYFITICTKDHKCIFWANTETSINAQQKPLLSKYGSIVEEAICNISVHYPAISVDQYVIMPNHVHLLLQIHTDEYGRPMVVPTISTVVQQLKGVVTKYIGHSVWQKLFHDHVIRGERDYSKIWEYIANNPAKWTDDCFYIG
ncbi:MAG: transposase [Oscillospiraceae bacterium]|nr:transposase [Oscillospiraceae bacterium]